MTNVSTSAEGAKLLSFSELEEAQGGIIPLLAVTIAAFVAGATIGKNCGERDNRADDDKK